jgi:hypothetical protein
MNPFTVKPFAGADFCTLLRCQQAQMEGQIFLKNERSSVFVSLKLWQVPKKYLLNMPGQTMINN